MKKLHNLYKIEDIENLSIKQIKSIYKKNINPSLIQTIGKLSFANDLIHKAEGQYIYTNCGKKILDFTGGYGVLSHGHNNKKIINSRINFQKKKKMEVHKNILSPYLACLSHNISTLLPEGLNKVFLPNSGAEANEGAIKLAYKYFNGNKKYILHSDISFHGKLLGTGSISNSEEINFKFQGLEFKDFFKYNNIDSLRDVVKRYKNDIYAIILEPFSASTLTPLNNEFLITLKDICSKNDIILIFDEVFTSWSKTGKLFYFEYTQILPDILTFSKSFGGGKSSISGYVANDKVFNKAYANRSSFNLHSSTYNGFGEECITALEAINIIIEENYCEKALKFGVIIENNLNLIKKKFLNLGIEPRGVGALRGFKLNINNKHFQLIQKIIPRKAQRFCEKIIYTAIVEEMYSNHKILTAFSTNKEIVFWILPPLCSEVKDLELFFDSLIIVFNKGLINIVKKLLKKVII